MPVVLYLLINVSFVWPENWCSRLNSVIVFHQTFYIVGLPTYTAFDIVAFSSNQAHSHVLNLLQVRWA